MEGARTNISSPNKHGCHKTGLPRCSVQLLQDSTMTPGSGDFSPPLSAVRGWRRRCRSGWISPLRDIMEIISSRSYNERRKWRLTLGAEGWQTSRLQVAALVWLTEWLTAHRDSTPGVHLGSPVTTGQLKSTRWLYCGGTNRNKVWSSSWTHVYIMHEINSWMWEAIIDCRKYNAL